MADRRHRPGRGPAHRPGRDDAGHRGGEPAAGRWRRGVPGRGDPAGGAGRRRRRPVAR
ncbi:hypothetical protein V2I01_26810 [Micromonospora sp. BRA006-A]|nr:hypothetical protein [Micromonospora sp. BRA006-A]